jgi:4-amino-4-deoxy-L-arabinose transferase-like glycosyltransferase
MSRINSAPAKYAILFFGCVFFHIAGTWNLPLIDRDEPRFSEASREMIERGDFVVPHFNGNLRLDKPPLTYWAQIVSYKVFGENDFAARLPSAIAAALIALSIVTRGIRISGQHVGWWAAIIFTLCVQTFIHAKAAVADMWLALFVTLAHWSGFQLLRDGLTQNEMPVITRKTYWLWWSAFYLSLALGFLAKGPIAWVPLLTVASTMFYAQNLRLGQRFKFVRGIVLMLAIIALWGIPALVRTHGEFFRIGIGHHVVGRSFGAMEGHGWNSLGGYLVLLPFYFLTVFVSLFPWSIRLPSLVRKLWRTRDNIDNYLFSGAAIVFIIFTLIKTKLPHYTLPAFALISLLLARHWPEEKRAAFRRIAVASATIWLAIAFVVPPLVASSFPAYALFQESREFLRPEMEFASVDYNEPSLVWYFRSRVKGFMTQLKKKDVAEFMNKDGPRFVILSSTLAAKIFPSLPSSWKTFSTHGLNIAKGRNVDLTLLLKER